MPKFYRVHHKSSVTCGMYVSCVSNHMFELETRHPSPPDDDDLRKDAIAKGYENNWPSMGYYGFKSLEQFRTWVYKDEWLDRLHAEDYVISLWEFDDPRAILIGATQAIYNMYERHPKRTVSIHDYLQLDQ